MASQDETLDAAKSEIVFLPVEEVERRVGLSRRTIYRMVGAGEFPTQINISERRIAWVEAEVVAWQQDKLRRAGRA